MRLIILACLTFTPFSLLFTQIVTTFAGIPDSTGTNDGNANQATFNNPHGMAVGEDGTLYITDRFNHTIRKITLEGQVSTIAGQAGVSGESDGLGADAQFYEPWGITVDSADNLYVADTRNNKIRKITPEGLVSTYAGTGAYGISNGPGNVATFGFPTGIEMDKQGNLYVADHNTHIIRKINSTGFVSTIAGIPYVLGNIDGPSSTATFNRPYGLTLDQDGNIYVADEWNHKVRKISIDGVVTTLAGTGYEGSTNGPGEESEFRFPWDVTIDANGVVYVADGLNYAIRKITQGDVNMVSAYTGNMGVSGAVDGFGEGASFVSATGIAYSTFTREIFVTDAYNDIIRRVTDINEPVEIRIEEGALLDCPEDEIAVSIYPPLFELYEFYIDEQLVELTSTPSFDTLNLTSGIHTIKVIPYYDFIPAVPGTLEIERYQVAPPVIDPQSSLTFFEGDSVLLRANEGIDYFWSNGEITREITVRNSQVLTVEVVDFNECMEISEPKEVVVVPLPDPIIVVVEGPSTFCLSQNVMLSTNYSGELQWYKDGEAIEDSKETSYKPVVSGSYQVEHTMDNGLKIRSQSVQVEVIESPILSFYSEINIVRPNEVINLNSTSENVTDLEWLLKGDNYEQSFFGDTPEIRLGDPGVYDVHLIGESGSTGCRDTLIKEDYLKVLSEAELEDDVFIPNIFTPNGDGKNDILYARGGDLVEIEFLIFNKEGQLVFSSNAKEFGWDGNISGSAPLVGNYSYLLKYVNRFGTKKTLKGKFVLHK